MDAWDLVHEHRYAEALALYDEEAREKPEDYLVLANRATVLLCMGKLDVALNNFALANELQYTASKRTASPFSEDIATIQWLRGESATAVQTLRNKIDGLRHGSLKFSDMAGGISTGLLLWFMGERTADANCVEYAKAFVQAALRRPKGLCWPGPIARYLMDEITFSAVLRVAGGCSNLEDVARKAMTDLLVRRQYCQSLFYKALRMQMEGDKAGYDQWMIACSKMENPIIEREWYLARGECEKKNRGS